MQIHPSRHPRIQKILSPLAASLLAVTLLAACRAAPSPAHTATAWVETTETAIPLTPTETIAPAHSPSPTPRPAARRVLIVSFDGLRADALLRSQIPVISKLINGGASSFQAQTVYPSSTLPGHTSMLSGRCVDHHGITWNNYIPANGFVDGPTLFSTAHEAGLRTIMVVGKEKLITIAPPGTVDSFRLIGTGDEATVAVAMEEADADFGVMFVHFWFPDYVGHLLGWMSPSYLDVIGRDDMALGGLLDGLEAKGLMEDTLVIVTADHGGHDGSHGSKLPEDLTIPWIAYWPGVTSGSTIDVPVSVIDTAPTALWALGLPIPEAWDGRPVVEAFGLTAGESGIAEASPNPCGS